WGLGFASTNSMQQVRLVAAAPPLASATVALNTSVLYIGQAVGSAVGGLLFARAFLHTLGLVAGGLVVSLPTLGFVPVGFFVAAMILVVLTRPRRAVARPA